MAGKQFDDLIRQCRDFADMCGTVPFIATAKDLLYRAAMAIEEQQERNEELESQLVLAKKREFVVNTPKGKIKVWSKFEVDDPTDYPGVFIDMVAQDGLLDLLCCVEYDSVADGIYVRVYAEGDEPSDSIRFENLD